MLRKYKSEKDKICGKTPCRWLHSGYTGNPETKKPGQKPG